MGGAPIAHERSVLMRRLWACMAFPAPAAVLPEPETRMARGQRAPHRTIRLRQLMRAHCPTLRIFCCWEDGACRYSAVPALLLRRVPGAGAERGSSNSAHVEAPASSGNPNTSGSNATGSGSANGGGGASSGNSSGGGSSSGGSSGGNAVAPTPSEPEPTGADHPR